MTSTFASRARQVLLVATASVLALALSSGPVLAETDLGHTGRVGSHSINDIVSNPVICHHQADYGRLAYIEVHTPTLYARDTGAGRQKQKVGWQMILLRRRPSHTAWKTFYKSEIVKARAWDDQSAFFPTRFISGLMFPDDSSQYALRAKMYWYKNGAVAGTALSQYDYYHEQDDVNTGEADTNYCYGQFIV